MFFRLQWQRDESALSVHMQGLCSGPAPRKLTFPAFQKTLAGGRGLCLPRPKAPSAAFLRRGFDNATTEVKSQGSTLRGREIPRNHHISGNDGLAQGRERQHEWSCSCLPLPPQGPTVNHLELVLLRLLRPRRQKQADEKDFCH